MAISPHTQSGFTLIEVLIVAAIIAAMSGFLLMNFGTSRVNLTAAANQLIAQVRDVQSRAVEGYRSDGSIRCGFGIMPDNGDRNQFFMYQGPAASTIDCATLDRNYDSGQDTIVSQLRLADPGLEFKDAESGIIFYNVFFEPPDPKTYINNNAALATMPARLLFGVRGSACAKPSDCRAVCIYPSGRIQRASGFMCP